MKRIFKVRKKLGALFKGALNNTCSPSPQRKLQESTFGICVIKALLIRLTVKLNNYCLMGFLKAPILWIWHSSMIIFHFHLRLQQSGDNYNIRFHLEFKGLIHVNMEQVEHLLLVKWTWIWYLWCLPFQYLFLCPTWTTFSSSLSCH